MIDPRDLLGALFGHLSPGFIEIRVIEDKKNGQVIERRWYESADALTQSMDHLNTLAEQNAAGVFFGVLPRTAIGLGKSADVLPGLACWVDLDFRDFAGGEAEARKVLDAFPVPPSVIVRSGHGLHAYWLFREPVEPSIIVSLSKRLARALNGDHAFDAARILRLPCTWNRKDPASPILVEIERFDPDRRYNPADLEEHLLPLDEETRGPKGTAHGSVKIGEKLSPRVIHILDQNPRLQELFEGRGKTAVDERGRRLDTSSSGYDYSIVSALARKGIRDESELATVLWFRPDEAARTKGLDYMLKTVCRALADVAAGERAARAESPSDVIDFTVQRVRVFASNPRKYEFTVDGASFELGTSDLLQPGRFRIRFMDALGRVPTLLRGGVGWTRQVEAWLEKAEVIEQPPEASPSGFLKEAILRTVSELRIGENATDLDRGLALHHKEQLIFKTDAIWRHLKENFHEVSPQDICSHLHDLGFVWRTPRIDGKGVRVWTRATESPSFSSTESAT